jgi:hypothetical protein
MCSTLAHNAMLDLMLAFAILWVCLFSWLMLP